MADELLNGGESNPEEGDSPNPDEVLEAALRERLGPDASLDNFEKYVKDEGGWLRTHNEKQQSLSQAEREASERAAALAETTAQHQMTMAQPQSQGQPQLTNEELVQALGAQSAGDVASVGQIAEVVRLAQAGNQQVAAATLAELEKRDEEIAGFKALEEKLEPFLESFYNNQAQELVNKVMEKHPHAYRTEVVDAVKNLAPGPDFEHQVMTVAAESEKRVREIGAQAALQKAQELQKKAERFRGADGVAAFVGEEHPKPTHGSGVTDFDKDYAAKTWVPQDGGDDI